MSEIPMTTDEMRENGQRLQAEAEMHIANGEAGRGTKQLAAQRAGPARVASSLWLIGAEICERLDAVPVPGRTRPVRRAPAPKVKDPR